MIAKLTHLVADESGGVLVEYALVLGLVSMVAIGALQSFGSVLETFFANSSAQLANVAQAAK